MGFSGQPSNPPGWFTQKKCPEAARAASSPPSNLQGHAAVPKGGKRGTAAGTTSPGQEEKGDKATPSCERQQEHRAAPKCCVSLKERHPQPLHKLLIRHLTS